MYLDKLSTQEGWVSRQVINTGEGYQHRGGGVSRQVINTGEGWVYLDKLSTQGRVGGI